MSWVRDKMYAAKLWLDNTNTRRGYNQRRQEQWEWTSFLDYA